MYFRTPPKDFKYDLTTVTCIIEHGGKILLIRRLPDKVQGGRWGVPGGKAEAGEDLADALVREIREETGININPIELQPIGAAYVRYPEFDFTNHQYRIAVAQKPEVKIKADEHDNFIWVTPEEAMATRRSSDLDVCFREYYRNRK
ncbi:MAG: NUDIX domain-containing protein [Patescibacteria group bacterium]|nr:NUDIX domain-containing protein [Patescibacteria group bacterium]